MLLLKLKNIFKAQNKSPRTKRSSSLITQFVLEIKEVLKETKIIFII